MRKAVFFDVDGTLYKEGRGVPESTREGIRKLRENGHLAFVCSGRGRLMVPEEILDIGFDGILATCGMYGEFRGEKVFEYRMEEELVHWTRRYLAGYKSNFIMEGNEWIFYEEEKYREHGADWYIKAILAKCPECFLPIAKEGDVRACKCGVHIFGDENTVERGFAGLKERFQVMRHTPNIAEIVPHGHSKGTGIRHICEKLGIALTDTFSFGDSCNDVAMLQTTNTGIVMGDGTDAAMAYADYVTSPLYEDGIWNGLSHFGLLKKM